MQETEILRATQRLILIDLFVQVKQKAQVLADMHTFHQKRADADDQLGQEIADLSDTITKSVSIAFGQCSEIC